MIFPTEHYSQFQRSYVFSPKALPMFSCIPIQIFLSAILRLCAHHECSLIVLLSGVLSRARREKLRSSHFSFGVGKLLFYFLSGKQRLRSSSAITSIFL